MSGAILGRLMEPCRFTVEQLIRLHAIVDQWNAIRRDDRQKATAGEVIDYLLTQEEISFEAMQESEVREELTREDLADADEKPLPPIQLESTGIILLTEGFIQ